MYTSPSPNGVKNYNDNKPLTLSPVAGGSSSSHHNGGSLALVKRLKLLASDVENQPIVCRRGVLPSLLLFLQNTDPEVRIIAAETLVLLSSHADNPDCLCRERGLVQIVVSSYRSSKDSDPVLHELCGSIIKNLGPAVSSVLTNQNQNNRNNHFKSPSGGEGRSGSTFTQLEFLSSTRRRKCKNSNKNNQNDDDDDGGDAHGEQQQLGGDDRDDEDDDDDDEKNKNAEGGNGDKTPSPNARHQGGGAAARFNPMTTTRRFNPRTRSSHFINGGMPPSSTCRNVQFRIGELVPARRQQLVECLHTTRGVVSYTIDLPTRNLTVFLSVPAENLVTTLHEDGFHDVRILADVEVAMDPTSASGNSNDEVDENGANANINNRHNAAMIESLNQQYYMNSRNLNNNEAGGDPQHQQLSEYKKSLMVGGASSSSSSAAVYDKENSSLIARIQRRKEMEVKQTAWGNVWEVLKNVFW